MRSRSAVALAVGILAGSALMGACQSAPSTAATNPPPTADSRPGERRQDTARSTDEALLSRAKRAPEEEMRAAVGRSLPFLQREGLAWMDGRTPYQDGQGCVSCHQVPFVLWGWGVAQRAGVATSTEAVAELSRRAEEHSLEGANGRPAIHAPLLLATASSDSRVAGRRPELVRQLLEAQERSGHWRARGQFPSQRRAVEETDATITLWTLLALPSPGEAPVAASREEAARWIAAHDDGISTEWQVVRALVAQRRGDSGRAATLFSALIEGQNLDGGWGFLPGEASDPMTTGQVLYGLASSSGAAEQPRTRAIGYLLLTQQSNGAWKVASRRISEEPSPAGDYVYDVWGTAWATIGLSRSLLSAEPSPAEPVVVAGGERSVSVAGRDDGILSDNP